jgi:NAD(P)-dependent dehydrogenase (short-subunit alcohol dehydrogenase family)
MQTPEKTALVFGAGSGIGRATAIALARIGMRVGVVARSTGALETLAADVRNAGGTAEPIAADVTNREEVDAAVRRAVQLWDGLDVVVNSAGTNIKERRLERLSQADWSRMIAVNLDGAFHTTQAALGEMRSRGGGLIVQISSVSGRWADGSGAAYQAAKHGVVGLCQAAMYEERLNGIRVTAILPGLVDTPLVRRRPVPLPQEVLDQAMRPEDVAAACVFLAQLPARSYIPELIMMPPRLQCNGHTAV